LRLTEKRENRHLATNAAAAPDQHLSLTPPGKLAVGS
jgi:hypothetical protein